jgi:hypothetical protein
VINITCWAQPDSVWIRTYGGDSSDAGYSIQVTDSGELLLIGSTNSFGAGGYDTYVVRTNSWGDTLWTRTYGTEADESGWQADVTTEGNYHIANRQIFAVCIDSSGDSLWARNLPVSADWDEDMAITHDSGYLLAGSNGYARMQRFDSLGQELWSCQFGVDPDTSYSCFFSVIAASDGGFLGTG